ncbi:MAG: hypothetical protein JWO82_3443 [Akkermansiaceae bacterium]|nr:hypothetical protein [Akkermansiaceae bacterium]
MLLVSLCSISLLPVAWSHEHEDKAPPPPAERRTNVSAEQLAKLLKDAPAPAIATPETLQLPPLPAGVEELNFKDFYKMPVGPLGLEPTAKLQTLNGKRVRIVGFMAEIKLDDKRQMIFSSVPLKPQPEEYGVADEIPATHILVTVPGNPEEEIRFTPGPMLLTGVLSVGTVGGETSFVRMQLDEAPTSGK